MYQNYNIHKKNFVTLFESIKQIFLSLGQKQKFNFNHISDKFLMPEKI